MAVYFYFGISLVGRQWVQVHKQIKQDGVAGHLFGFSEDPEELDLYFPIFLTFEFLFYMGWLKVASALYNPFGDDDDDFAVMDLMNRHIKVCMQIVDDDHDDIPEVMDDDFWKPPPGASPNWQPSMEQRLEEQSSLQIDFEKPEFERSVSVRKWSELSKAAVDQQHQQAVDQHAVHQKHQHAEEEAICIEPGQVSFAEQRDPGKAAVC